MRKNGIEVILRSIEGGVCAPDGYKANAVSCGLRKDGGLDFGIIFSEKRCAVACAFATGKTLGAPVKVSKKNMRNGYIRAILVNGGVANALNEQGEKLALGVCDLFFRYGVERTEIVVASTGKMGEQIFLSSFQKGASSLYAGLASSDEQSRKVVEAIRGEDEAAKQLSFSFDIGDYPCKIGAIFKGGRQTAPNTATFLAFLTTDANISTPMLQRALNGALNETVNLLNLDGTASPNDTICIMANGKAGNYRIDCPDSEYKKFARALRAVLTEICRETAREGALRVLRCRVTGAISKEVSRTVAKTLVGANVLKNAVATGETDVDGLLCALLSSANGLSLERVCLRLKSDTGEAVLYEDGYAFSTSRETMEKIAQSEEIEFRVELNEGNYQSLAFGQIKKRTNFSIFP